MSKKPERRSGEELGLEAENSVYDFLYHDARRIGSFLAQFDPNGYLQTISTSRSLTETEASKYGVAGTGGIPVVASVNMVGEGQDSSANTENSSRTYDPLWTNAIAFFDYLHQKKLIGRDIASARIGQFVLCSGSVTVTDTALLQRLYKRPSLRRRAFSFVNPITGKPNSKDEVELSLDVIDEMAPQVQVYMRSDDRWIFCTLRTEGMIAASADIAVKYGVALSGVWHVLGIKDADTDNLESIQAETNALKLEHKDNLLFGENADLHSRIRLSLGRPIYCYGVTPLAIFRQIGS